MQIEVVQTNSGIYYNHNGDMLEVPCQWFALCTSHATTTRAHPALGDVPICQRCNDRI